MLLVQFRAEVDTAEVILVPIGVGILHLVVTENADQVDHDSVVGPIGSALQDREAEDSSEVSFVGGDGFVLAVEVAVAILSALVTSILRARRHCPWGEGIRVVEGSVGRIAVVAVELLESEFPGFTSVHSVGEYLLADLDVFDGISARP